MPITSPPSSGGDIGTIPDNSIGNVKIASDAAIAWSKISKSGAVAADIGAAALTSPTFAGTPTAPTAADGTNTTQIATTAFVMANSGGGGGSGGVIIEDQTTDYVTLATGSTVNLDDGTSAPDAPGSIVFDDGTSAT